MEVDLGVGVQSVTYSGGHGHGHRLDSSLPWSHCPEGKPCLRFYLWDCTEWLRVEWGTLLELCTARTFLLTCSGWEDREGQGHSSV